MERMMECAEEWYSSSKPGLEALPRAPGKAIAAAMRMYREILNEVRANQYDNLRKRAYVPGYRKCALLIHDGYERRKQKLQLSSRT
jgi:phytoene synthase